MPMPHGFEKPYAAFLFDMDGTILNSIRAAERVWGDWARRHGLDVAAFCRRCMDRAALTRSPG